MFVPVACSQCGKPFQVPGAAVGSPTVCPWCNATVSALPVGTPPTAPACQESPKPLSLDDAPVPAQAPVPAPSLPSRFRWWLAGIVALFALVIAAGTTVGVKRYKQGHMVAREWRTFAAPDKSCSIDLLGRAAEDAETGSDERRYVSEGWYSGTMAWIGWRDLTQAQVQVAETKDAWQHLKGIFDTERDRLKLRHGGTLTKDATTKFEDPLTHEVRLEFAGGRMVERMIVMPKASRVYFVGMAGKFDPDGLEIQRLFDSLRVTE